MSERFSLPGCTCSLQCCCIELHQIAGGLVEFLCPFLQMCCTQCRKNLQRNSLKGHTVALSVSLHRAFFVFHPGVILCVKQWLIYEQWLGFFVARLWCCWKMLYLKVTLCYHASMGVWFSSILPGFHLRLAFAWWRTVHTQQIHCVSLIEHCSELGYCLPTACGPIENLRTCRAAL